MKAVIILIALGRKRTQQIEDLTDLVLLKEAFRPEYIIFNLKEKEKKRNEREKKKEVKRREPV